MILYKIHYSPWSLRALWVLEHHQLKVTKREYIPMLTAKIRWEIGDWSGPVTVPLLIDGDTVIRDSLDIARYAEEHGSGTPLLLDEDDVIQSWTAIAEQIADAGRALSGIAVAQSRAAKKEAVPLLPAPLRGLATPVVDLGWKYVAHKHGFDDADADAMHETMRAALERVSNRLVESDTLGEHGFGWPDIAIAASLQFVEPAAKWVNLGPATRQAFTRLEIAKEFTDVLSWRDNLLARYR